MLILLLKRICVTIPQYAADLFYIAPLYGLAFPRLDRLAVLDSTDLTLRCDLAELAEYYTNLQAGAVIAAGRDLRRQNLDIDRGEEPFR